MKRYNKSRVLASAACATAILFALPSCTDGFQDINRPGAYLSADELDRDNYRSASFIVQLENESFPEQENTYQMNQDLIGNYLGRYMTYANENFKDKNFAMFNAPNGWVRYPFKDSMPKTVSAFNEIARISGKQGVTYAWALILRATNFLRLTDMYGPLPIGADASNPNAYSSQEEVYKSLINDLNTATDILKPLLALDAKLTVAADQDKVYQGNMEKWRKYANSLKLRMAIRMSNVAPDYAKPIAEQAVKDGVITENADNTAIAYTPNGQWKTSVEWGDSRACADLESFLTGYKDPRLEKFFSPTATPGARPVIGCRAGANVLNKKIADPLYSAANIQQNSKGVWLTAAEMAFCRAEGILNNWDMGGGSVQSWYEKGIQLSFEQWGAGDASTYIANNTYTEANYEDAAGGYGGNVSAASTITIKWEAGATDAQMRERIATQKWIAMFPNGQEGWCEIRRTGYPKVFDAAQSTTSSLQVPNRIPFDQDERINNTANYNAAVSLLTGGDTYEAKMWWQK